LLTLHLDNLNISIYKKRKDRSVTNEPSDERIGKFSARQYKELKSSERDSGKVKIIAPDNNSPFQKAYQNNERIGSKKRRVRSKKHHTGSDMMTNDPSINIPDKNESMDVRNWSLSKYEQSMGMVPSSDQNTTNQKSISDLYANPNSKSIHVKKKSLQYAMKKSRINDLLKNNLSIEGGQFGNDKKIKFAINKELRKSSGNKRFKDFRHSSSSLPNAISLVSNLNNTRNRKNNLYPYESQQMQKEKKTKNNLRYDGFKRKYTIYNENNVVSAQLGIEVGSSLSCDRLLPMTASDVCL